MFFARTTRSCYLPARLVPGWSALLIAAGAWAGEAATAKVDFARDVQPILRQHCYECHAAERQESGYRLDVRELALGTADQGTPPIRPGDPASSPLLDYVAGTSDDGIVMPPEDQGARLPASAVATLRGWVEQGAPWPDLLAGSADDLTTDHWSFQPLVRPAPPRSRDPWIRNAVDAFILARLRGHDLRPSPEADRVKLIRRVYLVMLGLPPSPEDVERFVHDSSPTAYEELVDRVLASPHYGERWTRHWLDVVRYADTHGFETNRLRENAYPYRDYVIQAFNEDKPYDDFVREQICGDALGVDVATGFLVAGPYDLVKSPDINLTLMQRQDELADMVNTTGTTFLGLTLGCARCHTHKFDPIPQRDYYAVQAIFAGVNHGPRPVRSPDNAALRARLTQLEAQLLDDRRALDKLIARAKSVFDTQPPSCESPKRPAVDPRRNEDRFPLVTARAVRFTIHATNSGGEPCLDELEVYTADGRNVALASTGATAHASGTIAGYEIHKLEHINDGLHGNQRSWISNTAGTGWVQITFPEPQSIDRIVWGRDREQQFQDRLATDYVIEVSPAADQWQEVSSSSARQPLTHAPSERELLGLLPEAESARGRALATDVAAAEQRVRELSDSMEVAWIGTFQQPAATHRLYRGDPMAPREVVAPAALSLFGSLEMLVDEAEQTRRVRFADWMVSDKTPLTPRVIVNRLWQYHFGTGLVETSSDLGANGMPPSHPELLDWLAQELIDSDWSLKHIHRLILLSATFRQDSQPRAAGMSADAAARWLWRFPPRRSEAEVIRDSILAVAGSLDLRMGGPGFSAFEVNPENVHHYFPKASWGPAEWRRMVYMTKVRQEQDAVFGSFDCPDGNQAMPKRSRSTTPLQALNLFNSPFVLQQSGLFAARLRSDVGDGETARICRAFQLLYGRAPDAEELELSRQFAAQYGLDAFCRAMLNSNEFLFIF